VYGAAVNYIRSKLGLGTTVKEAAVIEAVEEGEKDSARSSSSSPEPVKKEKTPRTPRAPSPDLRELKTEIIDEIKDYFNSCKLIVSLVFGCLSNQAASLV